MSEFNFDYLVFIGRFQPFHVGHQQVVQTALNQARTVILLCGSADLPRTLRNPWFVKEREQMIRASFSAQDNARMVILPLHDVPYDDELWLKNVNQAVQSVHGQDACTTKKVGLIGHFKDSSSYYLNLFPQWEMVSVDNVQGINATDIRQRFFRLKQQETFTDEHLPAAVFQWLTDFQQTAAYANLQAEQRYIDDYKAQWAKAPYKPILVTIDAMVTQAGHILLVERKHQPGKGLWALPGGFLDVDEWLFDGCVRELKEETNLAISKSELSESLRKKKVYDAPDRSARGRTITHVFYFELNSEKALVNVQAADDAEKVFWQPLNALDRRHFFEDHYDIIQDMINTK